jgi:hypothetical protein
MPTDEPVAGRCGARLTSGTGYCANPAGKNTDHLGHGQCSKHGGSTRNGRKAGARMRAEGMVGALIVEALGVVEEMPGHDQLGQAIRHAGAMALGFRWLLDELPVESEWSFEVRYGGGEGGAPVRWVNVQTSGLIGPDSKGQATLHPYEAAFEKWTKLHAQLLKVAHDIGMEERRQLLAERQVAVIGDALRSLVEGLGHELDDPVVVPIVEKSLRLIASAAA